MADTVITVIEVITWILRVFAFLGVIGLFYIYSPSNLEATAREQQEKREAERQKQKEENNG